jgi:hypothetical protein
VQSIYFAHRFPLRAESYSSSRIIELLREVHLIAFKEIERLNLRIAELEGRDRQPIQPMLVKSPTDNPLPPIKPAQIEIMDERPCGLPQHGHFHRAPLATVLEEAEVHEDRLIDSLPS